MTVPASALLSRGDISWIRLMRHEMECQECHGLRRVGGIRHAWAFALTVAEPAPLGCEKRRQLLEAHLLNVESERSAEK